MHGIRAGLLDVPRGVIIPRQAKKRPLACTTEPARKERGAVLARRSAEELSGERGGVVRRSTILSVLVALFGALALLAAGCGGDNESSGTEATTGGAGGGKTVKIVSDLPLQGSSAAQTEQMNNAVKLYLQDIGNKVGDYTIEFEAFDDSTAAKGAWDEATCAANARKYVEDEAIVGVIGTFNSGCAKIEVPIANEASLAYVSPANTGTGLTHEGPGAESGEPAKYYPTGTRNYARVVTSDDVQGAIDATYMKDKLGVTKVFILDDKDAYGKGVADAFEQAANDIGLAVAGHEGWDANAQNYKALMTKIKSSGADGIFVGGISCFNGGQLIKDKVAVVGDNDTVKTVVSDGFVQASLFDEAGADNVEGVYGTAPTLNPDDLPGAGKEFNAKVEQQFGKPEVYTAYAVASLQMLLAALESSDGTREGVTEQLLKAQADTVVGPISFDENGDPADKFESVFQAKDGNWEFVEQIAAP
jgi:branched-chain amino acid transport system substrate-binding protein